MDDRYRGIYGTRDIVLINKNDMVKLDLDVDKLVTLYNEYNGRKRSVSGLTLIPYNIPEGCVATYFPECNPLIPLDQKARKSNTPASKSIKIKILQ
jgi:anaerobic selenocysteine-containing dehydrogenase